jgi:hypothetical protein
MGAYPPACALQFTGSLGPVQSQLIPGFIRSLTAAAIDEANKGGKAT